MRAVLLLGSMLTLLACSPPPPAATDAGMEGGVVVGVPMDDAGPPGPDPTDSGSKPDARQDSGKPDSGKDCKDGWHHDDDDDDDDHHW